MNRISFQRFCMIKKESVNLFSLSLRSLKSATRVVSLVRNTSPRMNWISYIWRPAPIPRRVPPAKKRSPRGLLIRVGRPRHRFKGYTITQCKATITSAVSHLWLMHVMELQMKVETILCRCLHPRVWWCRRSSKRDWRRSTKGLFLSKAQDDLVQPLNSNKSLRRRRISLLKMMSMRRSAFRMSISKKDYS